ncbi:hypothetical protein ACFU99_25480, partial [Streptomyces sp. NPDC057654]|uniref:hypothetical protein n=1 Tax=Streptomyces sp. NPDC057654 TaxID=3346196 RepID=UPI0036B22803
TPGNPCPNLAQLTALWAAGPRRTRTRKTGHDHFAAAAGGAAQWSQPEPRPPTERQTAHRARPRRPR